MSTPTHVSWSLPEWQPATGLCVLVCQYFLAVVAGFTSLSAGGGTWLASSKFPLPAPERVADPWAWVLRLGWKVYSVEEQKVGLTGVVPVSQS